MWRLFIHTFSEIDRREIDEQDLSRSRIPIALFCAGLSLLFVHYLKFNHVFYAFLKYIGGSGLVRSLGGYADLYAYVWWSCINVVGFVVMSLACIKWILKDDLKYYHVGWGSTHRHWKGYLALLSSILILVVLVTVFGKDFAEYYPFYRLAGRSAFDLLVWEVAYVIQFIALEFFFRGFLLGACKRQLGSNAIFVMMLPYLMFHFPKLWLEASGALFFGLFLGMLALRSRSIWGGVIVHVCIAVSMDLAALIKRGALF